MKLNWNKYSFWYGYAQRRNTKANTTNSSIIIPSSRAVDEDLSFSLNFLIISAEGLKSRTFFFSAQGKILAKPFNFQNEKSPRIRVTLNAVYQDVSS